MQLGDKNWRFKPQCGVGWGGEPLATVIANTMEECLVACARRNYVKADDCVAAEFTASLPAQGQPGNCLLRSQKTSEAIGKQNMVGASVVKV